MSSGGCDEEIVKIESTLKHLRVRKSELLKELVGEF